MHNQFRYRMRAACLLAATLLLSACAGAAAQATAPQPTSAPTPPPTATAAPTATPAPTAVPTLAKQVTIAGVDVGGLTLAEAQLKIEQALAEPLTLKAGDQQARLDPATIGAEAQPLGEIAEAALAAQAGANVTIEVRYDAAKLRDSLGQLSEQLTGPPAITVISSTKAISRSFALSGGLAIDLDKAEEQIGARLQRLGGSRDVALTLAPAADARPTPEQLQQQIQLIAKGWKDVAGVMVYDLATGQELASLNKNTVFSAASTIKAAIMLNAYIQLDSFTAKQDAALKKMIVDSDNIAANAVMAAAAGGAGTEDALKGAEQMSAMLAGLGLKNTYLYVPFEATDYLAQKKVKFKLGPKRAGEAPFTDSGRALRTSPAEMATLYLYIDQCSRGEGVLLEKFERLSAKRCQEMLDRLFANADRSRMRSGLDRSVRVEHKSGWIDDMQADAGIVRSPGGDFVIATYLFRATKAGTAVTDKTFAPYLGAFTRLVYSYYNPVVIEQP